MTHFSECVVERAALACLEATGWRVAHGPNIAPDMLLFLEYLRRNGLLLRADGEPRLADNAMVALALLIAESESSHKDLMIRLVLNLLEDGE
jgi:hypothetical protein